MSNNGSPTVDMMMKILNLYTLEYQKRTSFTAIDERFYFFYIYKKLHRFAQLLRVIME